MDNLSVDNFNESAIYNYFNQENQTESDSGLKDKLKFVPSRLLGQMHYLAERKGDKLVAKNIKKLCKERGDLGAITKQHISCFFKHAMKKADNLDMSVVCNNKYLESRKDLLELVPEAIELLKGEEYRELEGLDLVFYTLVNKPKVTEKGCHRLNYLIQDLDRFTAYSTINKVIRDKISSENLTAPSDLKSQPLRSFINPLVDHQKNFRMQNEELINNSYSILVDNCKQLFDSIITDSNHKTDQYLSKTEAEQLIETINKDIKEELQQKKKLLNNEEANSSYDEINPKYFYNLYINNNVQKLNQHIRSGGYRLNQTQQTFLERFKSRFSEKVKSDDVQLIRSEAEDLLSNLENINIEHPQIEILKGKLEEISRKDDFTEYDKKDLDAIKRVIPHLKLIEIQNEFYSNKYEYFNQEFGLERSVPTFNSILDHVDFTRPTASLRFGYLRYTDDLTQLLIHHKRKLASTCYILQKKFEPNPQSLEDFQEKTNKEFMELINEPDLNEIHDHLIKLYPNEIKNWEGDVF